MTLKVESLKCIRCQACEMACNFYRDGSFSSLSSSIMLVEPEEKKNYFGIIIKAPQDVIILGKPEGVEKKTLEELQSQSGREGGSTAKPILLRASCDECNDPLCVQFCPPGAITKE